MFLSTLFDRLPQMHRMVGIASIMLWCSFAGAQSARWESCGGIQGTKVQSIVVGPDGAKYVATDRGVYVWTDTRRYWAQLIGGSTPRGAEILHWSANGELMAIDDRLSKWDAVTMQWSTILDTVDASAIATTKRGDIFLGMKSGPDPIRYSRDNGKTWQYQEPLPGGPARISHFLVEQDSVIWAVTSNGLFRSVWGENWSLVSSEIKEGRLYRGPDGRLWANGATALMRSIDEGETWTQRYTRKIVGLIQLDKWTMVGTSQGVYKSSDFGETWQLSYLKNYSMTALESDSSGNGIAGSSVNDIATVFFSSKGLFDWTWVSDILQIGRIKAMAGSGTFSYAAMTDDGKTRTAIIRSQYGGQKWDFMDSVEGRIHSLISTPNGTVYAAGDNGVSRSNDNGATWSAVNNGLYDLRIGGIYAISDDTLLVTAHVAEVTAQGEPPKMPYGIYRSVDSGATWQLFNDNTLAKKLAMGPITVTDAGWIYAAQQGPRAYYSSDHGVSWNTFDLPIGGDVEKLVSIGNGQMLITLDSTSYILTQGTNELQLLDRKIDHVDKNGGFWSMDDTNVFRSLDQGKTWWQLSDGLLLPMALTKMTEDASYYLLGGETGLYRMPKQTAFVRITSASERRKKLKLYPNPASDRINIELSKRVTTTADIRFVNMIGQTVYSFSAQSVDGRLDINLPGLSAGQYFIEVRTEDGIEAAHLVIE